MLNVLIMYKINNEINCNLILVFYVIEAKFVMAVSKKLCRQSELPISNKLYWFGWDIPKENLFVETNPLNLLNLIDLANHYRLH